MFQSYLVKPLPYDGSGATYVFHYTENSYSQMSWQLPAKGWDIIYTCCCKDNGYTFYAFIKTESAQDIDAFFTNAEDGTLIDIEGTVDMITLASPPECTRGSIIRVFTEERPHSYIYGEGFQQLSINELDELLG